MPLRQPIEITSPCNGSPMTIHPYRIEFMDLYRDEDNFYCITFVFMSGQKMSRRLTTNKQEAEAIYNKIKSEVYCLSEN